MILQILIDKEQTILRKNTLLVLEEGNKTTTKISNDIDRRVHFTLCTSCFWCASCLSSKILSIIAASEDSPSLAKCPSCNEGNIEFIPIAESEEYRFDYDVKRGVTMEFFR
jgi:hypothetical protein